MDSDWRDTTLGEFVTLQRGHDLTDAERRPGTVPVVGAAGQNGFHDKAVAKGPGIVVGRSGASFGQVHYCQTAFWPHNTGLYVTDFRGNDPRFAFYFLKALDFSRYNSGSAQPSLNRNFIYPIEIRVPSLSAQRAIARILGTLDDKIELNRQMNETLEAMARALFKAWFVDFEPVRAKAEGRDTGLPKDIADLFPDSFEDSELGEVPKGWQVGTLPEFIEVNPSRSLPKGQIAPYLDMANVPTNTARADQVVEREFGSGTKFKNGDTLLARITPCLENGKTAYVDFLNDNQVGWGSTEFIVMRPKAPLPPEFAYFLARDESFRTFAISNMTGTSGRQRVPADCFNNYVMAAPAEGIAMAFGHQASVVMQKIKANDEETSTLAAQRDTLLPKLLTGELKCSNIIGG